MGKDKPAVNAIMRGVYFKDKPVDLDKGKYENRLTLLKVPRLTKERILRVALDTTPLEFTGVIPASFEETINISTDSLLNSLNIKALSGDVNDVDFIFTISDSETIRPAFQIYVRHCTGNLPYYNEISFKPLTEFEIKIENESTTASLVYHILIDNTVRIQENTYSQAGRLNASELIPLIIFDTKLLNRLTYVFWHSAAQDYTIRIYTYVVGAWKLLKETNITGAAGAVIDGTINFIETNSVYVYIKNNNATNGIYFQTNLFFSKKVLASELNLADLNEKSYNSLTDKPTINNKDFDFHLIGSIGRTGFTAAGYYGLSWMVAAADASAEVNYSYYIKNAGSYSIQILYATSGAGTGVASGKLYCSNISPPAQLSWNKVNGLNCDLSLGTAWREYRKTYGNVDLVANAYCGLTWLKDAVCNGTNLLIYGVIIVKN